MIKVLNRFLPLFILILSSCGAETESDRSVGIFDTLGFTGEWTSTCAKEEDSSLKSSMKFAGNSFSLTYARFETTDCVPDSKFITYTYLNERTEKLKKSDLKGYESFSYTVKDRRAVVHKQNWVELFNEGNVYGSSKWKHEVSQSISGRKFNSESEPAPENGSIRINTLRLKGSKVYMATYEDGAALVSKDSLNIFLKKK